MKIPVEWAEETEYLKDKSAGMRMHDEKRERRPTLKDDRSGKVRRTEKPRHVERSRRDEKPKYAERPKPAGKPGHIESIKHVEKTIGRAQNASAAHGKTPAKSFKKAEHTLEHSHHTRSAAPQREHRHHDEKKQKRSGTDRKQSLEDRITYYRKKYGDNFNIPAAPSEPKKRKRTKILDTIKGIFSRKKPSK
jgi:hypothetical protein